MTLDEWRIAWAEDDLMWNAHSARELDVEEKAERRAARTRRDRRYFGESLWVAPQPSQSSWWLNTYQLPSLSSEIALANWLGITLPRLRWFTYDKAVETVWHYYKFTIPKRSGGQRVIIAPKREIKALQRHVLQNLLDHFRPSDAAHGFIQGRSIVSNAAPHVGHPFMLKLDLKDFFPSISVWRAQRFFTRIYPSAVAAALALLMTEYDREIVEWHGETYYVSTGSRHLIQGAPTSPMMANILAYRLDGRLTGLAKSHGFAYTRYADDLTFSGDNLDSTLRILDVAQRIIDDEGFAVNPAKTRLVRRSSRQVVTGVVVNDHLSAPRDVRRTLRAILNNAQRTGLVAQNRDHRPDFRAYVRGLIGYISEINPTQAAALMSQLDSLSD